MRPSQVVGLEYQTLLSLTENISPASSTHTEAFHNDVLDLLYSYDVDKLAQLFQARLQREGLSRFVQDILEPMNRIVGDRWLRGEMSIAQEHLYTQSVTDVLQSAVTTIPVGLGTPRILLATPPGEIHTLGLLMARAILGLEGAACVSLGAQMPVPEIARAVAALQIDIVGISTSAAQAKRVTIKFLHELRTAIDPKVRIWVGGTASERLPKRVPGVAVTIAFDDAIAELEAFRRANAPAAAPHSP